MGEESTMTKHILLVFLIVVFVTPMTLKTFSNETDEIVVILTYLDITSEQLTEKIMSGEIPKNVTWLDLSGNQISDITPLSELTELRQLFLVNNQIIDLTPLSGLTNLETLDLYRNQITDITPLSGLKNLGGAFGGLFLGRNQIVDISSLSSLTKLEWLELNNNLITDFTPLESLTNLTFVTLHDNPATDEHIAEVRANMKKFSTFVNRVLGNEPVTINEALEILMYLAGMESSIISEGNVAFYAARITGGETPTIMDALEILMHLAGLESAYG
jgi:hypothetical protein